MIIQIKTINSYNIASNLLHFRFVLFSFSLFVLSLEQWNEFAIDGEEEETSEDYEDLIKRISFEQYGCYPPYA